MHPPEKIKSTHDSNPESGLNHSCFVTGHATVVPAQLLRVGVRPIARATTFRISIDVDKT